MSQLLLWTFAAAALAWASGFPVLGLLNRLNIVDKANARSSHEGEIPRGGGLAVLLAFFVGAGGLFFRHPQPVLGTLIALVALQAGMSFFDDRRPLSWRVRLGVHFVTAALMAVTLTITGWELGGKAFAFGAIAIVWMAGYANAFNFMDGINGLAGAQALVTGLGMAAIGIAGGVAWSHDAVVLAVVLAGASGGFLPHNFPRARMFMGDVGSVPIGFLLAALAAWLVRDGGTHLALPLFCLHLNFVMDTTVTVFRRWRRGEVLHEGHREHFYQRAIRGGASHAQVTYSEMALQAIVLALALGATKTKQPWATGAAALVVSGVWAVFFRGCERRFRRENEAAKEGRPSTR